MEQIWEGKATYSIEADQRIPRAGASLTVCLRFIPLAKGVKVWTLVSKVIETHDLSLESRYMDAVGDHKTLKRTICKEESEVGNSEPLEYFHDGAEGYKLLQTLKLPHYTSLYTQSFSTESIQVKHMLRISVRFVNAGGHLSEACNIFPSRSIVLSLTEV